MSKAGHIVNISAYLFSRLENLPQLRALLLEVCKEEKLKGTVLLSEEGINLFLAGERKSIDQVVAVVRSVPGLERLRPKESLSDHQPFNRLLVKIKKEIISFGQKGVNPADKPAPKITALTLKTWLDEKRPITLLDTRNDYEVKLGSFKGALNPDITHFRQFPDFVKTLPENLKNEPVVMFCTGGIRCEKAGPYMESQGFKNIYQLDGGILKYFEEVGSHHYEGDCFVFDGRVGVDPALAETPHQLCFVCQSPLTLEDQKSEKTVPGKSCPYCFKRPEEKQEELLRKRMRAIEEITRVLPGEKPYSQRRPLKVPQKWEGQSVLDCVSGVLKHISRDNWRKEIDQGLFETEEGRKLTTEESVKAGDRLFHVLPRASEPEISRQIKIIYEDEALVGVHKPAPLPVIASGRFQRNTLQFLLNQVYRPQFPRPVHRLDANTSGINIFAKTKTFAAFLHQQFEEKTVKKKYLVKVGGVPLENEFVCKESIASEPTEVGARILDPQGLEAETHFRVLERFEDDTALLEAMPITGRTNQIRVHLWSLGFPVLGDPLYLQDKKLGKVQTLSVSDPAMCLHAWEIRFNHPITRKEFSLKTEVPEWAKM